MKIHLQIVIDPPSAERCVIHGDPCGHWRPGSYSSFAGPSGQCTLFAKWIGFGPQDRLPECIAAEQQYRAMAGGILASVEEIARGLTTAGVLPAPKVDRVADDPVIALLEMEAKNANRR